MPFIMTAAGIQNTRDEDASGNIIASEATYSSGEFHSDLELDFNSKSFDIFITYNNEYFISPDEGHVIDLSFNQIDEGDNIIINVASNYKKLYSNIYNITNGGCSIYIHNQSNDNIPSFSNLNSFFDDYPGDTEIILFDSSGDFIKTNDYFISSKNYLSGTSLSLSGNDEYIFLGNNRIF